MLLVKGRHGTSVGGGGGGGGKYKKFPTKKEILIE